MRKWTQEEIATVSLGELDIQGIASLIESDDLKISVFVSLLDAYRLELINSGDPDNRDNGTWQIIVVALESKNKPVFKELRGRTDVKEAKSFSDWLKWSQLGGIVKFTQRFLVEGGGDQPQENTLVMPMAHLSLVLYYSAYCHNLLLHASTPHSKDENYHQIVDESLDALLSVRAGKVEKRALEVQIMKSKKVKPYSLFHRFYGRKQLSRVTDSSDSQRDVRMYLPAQFYFNNWKSVKIDNGTFRLFSALPEFYWIWRVYYGVFKTADGGKKEMVLDSITISGVVDHLNLYAFAIPTLEELVLDCPVDDMAPTHGTDRASDVLGATTSRSLVEISVKNNSDPDLTLGDKPLSLPRLRSLIVRGISYLDPLPKAEQTPLLEVLGLKKIVSPNKSLEEFLAGLSSRKNEVVRGKFKVPIQLIQLSYVQCASRIDKNFIVLGDRINSFELDTPICTTMPRFTTLSNLRVLRLGDFSVQVDAAGLDALLRAAAPSVEVLEIRGVKQLKNETFSDFKSLRELSLIDMGITNLRNTLSSKSRLEKLHLSPVEGALFDIPYLETPSLIEQTGFYSPPAKKDDPLILPLTKESMAEYRAHEIRVLARFKEEDAARKRVLEQKRGQEGAIVMSISSPTSSSSPVALSPVQQDDGGGEMIPVDNDQDEDGEYVLVPVTEIKEEDKIAKVAETITALKQYPQVFAPADAPWAPYTPDNSSYYLIHPESIVNALIWANTLKEWISGDENSEGLFCELGYTEDLPEVKTTRKLSDADDNVIEFSWTANSGSADEMGLIMNMLSAPLFTLSLISRDRIVSVRRDIRAEGFILPIQFGDDRKGKQKNDRRSRLTTEPTRIQGVSMLKYQDLMNDRVPAIDLGKIEAKGNMLKISIRLDAIPIVFALEASVCLSGYRTLDGRKAQELTLQEQAFAGPLLEPGTTWPHLNQFRLAARASLSNVIEVAVGRYGALGNPFDKNTKPEFRKIIAEAVERAEFSEDIALTCLLGLGFKAIASIPEVPRKSQIVSIYEKYFLRVMPWIMGGQYVAAEEVLFQDEYDNDEDEDGESVTETGGGGGKIVEKVSPAGEWKKILDRLTADIDTLLTYFEDIGDNEVVQVLYDVVCIGLLSGIDDLVERKPGQESVEYQDEAVDPENVSVDFLAKMMVSVVGFNERMSLWGEIGIIDTGKFVTSPESGKSVSTRGTASDIMDKIKNMRNNVDKYGAPVGLMAKIVAPLRQFFERLNQDLVRGERVRELPLDLSKEQIDDLRETIVAAGFYKEVEVDFGNGPQMVTKITVLIQDFLDAASDIYDMLLDEEARMRSTKAGMSPSPSSVVASPEYGKRLRSVSRETSPALPVLSPVRNPTTPPKDKEEASSPIRKRLFIADQDQKSTAIKILEAIPAIQTAERPIVTLIGDPVPALAAERTANILNHGVIEIIHDPREIAPIPVARSPLKKRGATREDAIEL